MPGSHTGFKSKAQWRYCWATRKKHPTWSCRKWAHETKVRGGYHALPPRKGVSLRTLR